MSCNTIPYSRPWPVAREGRTWAGVRYQVAGTGTLSTVVAVVKDSDGTASLTLNSAATGATLTTGTSGAWDFEMDQITAVGLSAGFYSYEITLTLSDGTKTDWFVGPWEVKT